MNYEGLFPQLGQKTAAEKGKDAYGQEAERSSAADLSSTPTTPMRM
jgi:hypothetical protein